MKNIIALNDKQSMLLAEQDEPVVTSNPAENYLASLSSPRSIETMRRILNRIARKLKYPDLHSTPWSGLSYRFIASYVHALQEKDMQPSTISLYLSACKGVSRFAFTQGLLSSREYKLIQNIKVSGARSSGGGKPLPPEKLEQLIASLKKDGSPATIRDLAVIGCLYGAGLRRHEVSKLTFGVKRSKSFVNIESKQITVIGKGNNERHIPINAWLLSVFGHYLELRGPLPGPFFYKLQAGKSKKRKLKPEALGDKGVYLICTKRGLSAIGELYSPHDYRRTFGTLLIEKGAALKEVQSLLGHKNVTTTQLYTRTNDEAKAKAVELLNL